MSGRSRLIGQPRLGSIFAWLLAIAALVFVFASAFVIASFAGAFGHEETDVVGPIAGALATAALLSSALTTYSKFTLPIIGVAALVMRGVIIRLTRRTAWSPLSIALLSSIAFILTLNVSAEAYSRLSMTVGAASFAGDGRYCMFRRAFWPFPGDDPRHFAEDQTGKLVLETGEVATWSHADLSWTRHGRNPRLARACLNADAREPSETG